jgi:hypothetical protein
MKLLAYTSPARGHLYPLVPILNEAISRGHRVDLCTLSSELDRLTTLGIGVQPIDPAIEAIEIEDWRKRSLLGATKSVMRTFAARARLDGPDLARAIERDDPDALLIDVNCWGAAAVAEASGRPWAIYSPYLLPLASRDAPPFGLGLRPRNDKLGAIRDSLMRPFASATLTGWHCPRSTAFARETGWCRSQATTSCLRACRYCSRLRPRASSTRAATGPRTCCSSARSTGRLRKPHRHGSTSSPTRSCS